MKKLINTITQTTILASLLCLLASCSIEPVKPWEKDLLAKPSMQLIADELENGLDEHIYFSKEGSTGGQSIGGGGCGCN